MLESGSGKFYLVVPKSPSISSWLLSRTRSVEKAVHQRLDSVLSSWEDTDSGAGAAGAAAGSSEPVTPTSLGRAGSLPPTPQTYVYKGGGLTVKLGLEEVADEIYKVKPYVYSAPDGAAAIVFSGHLTNLSELSRRASLSSAASAPTRGGGGGDPNNHGGYAHAPGGLSSPLERRSSIERSLDVGAATAAAVLRLYLDGRGENACDGGGGGECILLSELQGEYAFVIYDNRRKQAFAARDPSGEEPLFYHVGDDGAVSFAGSRMDVRGGVAAGEWRELPPGHFISGRAPRLQQFALTPQQLQQRELQQEDELSADSNGSSGGGADGGGGATTPAGVVGAPLRAARSLGRHSAAAALGLGQHRGGGGGGLLGLGAQEELGLASALTCRASLDADGAVKRGSLGLDGDVFSLDL